MYFGTVRYNFSLSKPHPYPAPPPNSNDMKKKRKINKQLIKMTCHKVKISINRRSHRDGTLTLPVCMESMYEKYVWIIGSI